MVYTYKLTRMTTRQSVLFIQGGNNFRHSMTANLHVMQMLNVSDPEQAPFVFLKFLSNYH